MIDFKKRTHAIIMALTLCSGMSAQATDEDFATENVLIVARSVIHPREKLHTVSDKMDTFDQTILVCHLSTGKHIKETIVRSAIPYSDAHLFQFDYAGFGSQKVIISSISTIPLSILNLNTGVIATLNKEFLHKESLQELEENSHNTYSLMNKFRVVRTDLTGRYALFKYRYNNSFAVVEILNPNNLKSYDWPNEILSLSIFPNGNIFLVDQQEHPCNCHQVIEFSTGQSRIIHFPKDRGEEDMVIQKTISTLILDEKNVVLLGLSKVTLLNIETEAITKEIGLPQLCHLQEQSSRCGLVGGGKEVILLSSTENVIYKVNIFTGNITTIPLNLCFSPALIAATADGNQVVLGDTIGQMVLIDISGNKGTIIRRFDVEGSITQIGITAWPKRLLEQNLLTRLRKEHFTDISVTRSLT